MAEIVHITRDAVHRGAPAAGARAKPRLVWMEHAQHRNSHNEQQRAVEGRPSQRPPSRRSFELLGERLADLEAALTARENEDARNSQKVKAVMQSGLQAAWKAGRKSGSQRYSQKEGGIVRESTRRSGSQSGLKKNKSSRRV